MIVFSREGAIEFQRRLKTRFRMRALEWEHAVIAVILGSILLAHPQLFDGAAFRGAVFQGPGPQVWGAAILAIGVARLLALAVNGYMARPTALIRAIAAAFGVALFGVISLGVLLSGTTITALASFLAITVFGAFSIAWAIVDVGVPDHHDDDHP